MHLDFSSIPAETSLIAATFYFSLRCSNFIFPPVKTHQLLYNLAIPCDHNQFLAFLSFFAAALLPLYIELHFRDVESSALQEILIQSAKKTIIDQLLPFVKQREVVHQQSQTTFQASENQQDQIGKKYVDFFKGE